MTTSCDRGIATVCAHNPQTATFTLSSGATIIERAMCNGATDVSLTDGREMTETEWQEYCQTVIPARWRDAAPRVYSPLAECRELGDESPHDPECYCFHCDRRA